ncbi:MAG: hypothetical protein WCR34_05510 [Bacilli bacterium]
MKRFRPKWKNIFFSSILAFILIFLTACNSGPTPAIKATEEFYINDRPHALLNATKWTILTYSENLYDDSREQEYVNQDISGTQIVVATYVGAVGDFNTTELFNTWEIGDNDMGILIVLFFFENEEEFIYNDMIIEIGPRMSGFLSAFTAEVLANDYFDDPSIPEFDYDQRLINYYFAIQQYIYINVYNYASYDFQSYLDEYEDNKYEFFGLLPSDHEIESLPAWVWVLIIIGILAFGIFPGRLLFPLVFKGVGGNRGGGGRSGGYWFRH